MFSPSTPEVRQPNNSSTQPSSPQLHLNWLVPSAVPSLPCHCIGWSAYLGAIAVVQAGITTAGCDAPRNVHIYEEFDNIIERVVLPAKYWYFD